MYQVAQIQICRGRSCQRLGQVAIATLRRAEGTTLYLFDGPAISSLVAFETGATACSSELEFEPSSSERTSPIDKRYHYIQWFLQCQIHSPIFECASNVLAIKQALERATTTQSSRGILRSAFLFPSQVNLGNRRSGVDLIACG